MQIPLDWKTIGSLDSGLAQAIIDAAIAEAARDLDDRGDDGKARKVEICLTMTQRPNGQVEVEVEACARAPKRRTNSTVCNLRQNHTEKRVDILFQEYAPGNPDQRTLDEA